MRSIFVIAGVAGILSACTDTPDEASASESIRPDVGAVIAVIDTTIADVVEAAAETEPFQQSVLSTKLLSRVESVAVREGDRVAAGTILVRLDRRDLDAKREQAQAAVRAADAARQEATLYAGRIQSLYADSAAPRAQLDGAVAGLTRAEQAVHAARAALSEVDALTDYSVIRAPFGGTIVRRFLDPGTLAAPGAPLVQIEDASRLRLVAAVTPSVGLALQRGAAIDVTVEGIPARGRVEGVVPAAHASLVAVQVIVDNANGTFSSGSAATVQIPGTLRSAMLVPVAALVHSGDLVGVRVTAGGIMGTRWLRLGRRHGDLVEVLSGLTAGDSIVTTAGL